MTFLSTANTIRSRFNTEFPIVQPTVGIAWDNSAFEPTFGSPFVRLAIREGDSVLAGLAGAGANLYRNNGIIIVQVFVPINTGDGVARTIADDIALIFRGLLVSGVHFRAPSVRTLGEDDAWWQLNVTIPFRADLIG